MAGIDHTTVLNAFHVLVQVHLFVFSVLAIWCIGGKTVRRRRLGFWFGLWNQWAWWATAIMTDSWGLLAVNIVYGAAYVRGLYNNPLLREEKRTMDATEALVEGSAVSEPRNPLLARALNEYVVDGIISLDTATDIIAQGYDLDSVEEWCARNMNNIKE